MECRNWSHRQGVAAVLPEAEEAGGHEKAPAMPALGKKIALSDAFYEYWSGCVELSPRLLQRSATVVRSEVGLL
jgi:hypothetical protein